MDCFQLVSGNLRIPLKMCIYDKQFVCALAKTLIATTTIPTEKLGNNLAIEPNLYIRLNCREN